MCEEECKEEEEEEEEVEYKEEEQEICEEEMEHKEEEMFAIHKSFHEISLLYISNVSLSSLLPLWLFNDLSSHTDKCHTDKCRD